MWVYHCGATTNYMDVKKGIFSGRGAFVMPDLGVPPPLFPREMEKHLVIKITFLWLELP
jgi:hypothetical protein